MSAAAAAYDRELATDESGRLVCDHCHLELPLVPRSVEGPVCDVVAERVRAFEREHQHVGFAIVVVLPTAKVVRRREKSRVPCGWCGRASTALDEGCDPACAKHRSDEIAAERSAS